MGKKRRTEGDAGKAIGGIGAAVAGMVCLAAASYAITRKMVQIALDRDGVKPSSHDERIRNHLCGFKGEDEFISEMEKAAELLGGEDTETVEITAHDGARLIGHFLPHENAERLIIAVHGWRSSWNRDFGMAVPFWRENNCSVLFIEQRGQGESGGEYMGFGLLERYDCREWAQWADERHGGRLPIYLDGVSMGATTVLMASGLELPESVHGIIADSGFTSPYAIWKHVTENYFHLSYGAIGRIADSICRSKIQMGTEDYSVADAMANNRIPVLFAHGTDDPFVPVEMTYENYKACRAPKRLLVVPGAAHGMSFYVEKERYAEELKRFWRDFD